MKKIVELFDNNQKWKLFGLILLAIVVIGTALSVVAKVAFLRDDPATRPRIAVVGPMNSPLGSALRNGVEMYLETLNKHGGFKERQLEIVAIEENAAATATISADPRIVGVIGYLNPDLLKQAAPQLQARKLPLVTPLNLQEPIAGVTSLGMDSREQARFVGNYARNVVQQRIMYVIREEGAKFDPLVEPFVDVYKRFETPVREIWTLSAASSEDEKLQQVLGHIKNIDIGAVYLATQPELAARLVKEIRAASSTMDIFGPEFLASGAFSATLKTLSGNDAAIQSHGIIAATPVLFDTANDEAQRFKTRYQQKFNASPDWLAVMAHDAARVALAGKPGEEEVRGLSGTLNFVNRQAQLPIQMGIYNGDNLISAPEQFLPIAKNSSFNYIEALRQGRVLFVNDRFMFKTNVVYVGVTLHNVSDLDLQKETATLDMSVWFRYRGDFKPHDLLINNAVEPVKFDYDNLEESKESDEVQYRRYRIKQKFNLNFTDAKRAYNQHIAGISFRHQRLNRNNLKYVVDVLGMPSGNALISDLFQRRVFKANAGWEVDNAWVSQDLVRERGDGAPQYVGMTGEKPLFSTITYGVLLKPSGVSARDVMSGEYFIYIGIFSVLGILFSTLMDTHRWGGRYWAMQSWLLRVLFWPLMLLSLGNLILDGAFGYLSLPTARTMALVYESMWWILSAWLADIAIRRFVWLPLEEKSQRKVPNVMKVFVSVLIFALGLAGIIAFVFNQALTSLLATSGVLAMVLGLAIQANIANVFSGIILNIERPFKVGDYVKINNIIGQVKDITWRTTRIESNDGQMISLANYKVSESLMENYSLTPHGVQAEAHFYTPPDVNVRQVLDIITEGIARSPTIICKDVPHFDPMVRFRGIINLNGHWVADFQAGYRVPILPHKSRARQEVWLYVLEKFAEHGIPAMPAEGFAVVTNPPPANAAIPI